MPITLKSSASSDYRTTKSPSAPEHYVLVTLTQKRPDDGHCVQVLENVRQKAFEHCEESVHLRQKPEKGETNHQDEKS